MTTPSQNTTSFITIDSSELDDIRSNVLKSQFATYRHLARNLPVSDSLLNSCSYKFQLATLIQNHIPEEQPSVAGILLTNSSISNDQNDSIKPLIFSSATDMYRSLTGSNQISEEKVPHLMPKHPINLNPLYNQQEQDKR